MALLLGVVRQNVTGGKMGMMNEFGVRFCRNFRLERA
jgi:hypothetical protein